MPYNYQITSKLNEILNERNMRQYELSNISGIPEPTISRFSRQNRYNIETLFAISDALDIKIEDLFIVNRSEITSNKL